MDAAPIPAPDAAPLLAWYDRHHRDLPWRIPPGGKERKPDPYRIWLSEIMLQQTRVEAVRPYFEKFLALWPDVAALAAAPLDDVLAAWAGLGYYSRARNLKRCAGEIVEKHGGKFPDTVERLAELPGIGAYTAGAIAAIAFNRPAIAMDGNVERVICRMKAIELPKQEARPLVRQIAQAMLPHDRPGDYAQALMDLGATICMPKRALCLTCPFQPVCEGRGDPYRYPARQIRPEKPCRRGAAFIAIRKDGAILLHRRPGKGLLAGMAGIPTTGWSAGQDGDIGTAAAPLRAEWREAGTVGHVFTHFALELDLWRADGVSLPAPEGCWWAEPAELASLPTLFRKAVERALAM